MRREKFVGFKRAGTLCRVGAALLAISCSTVCSRTTFAATAGDRVDAIHEDDDSAKRESQEKSIIIFAKRLVEGEESSVEEAVTEGTEQVPKPIANSSALMPDLADPLVGMTTKVAVETSLTTSILAKVVQASNQQASDGSSGSELLSPLPIATNKAKSSIAKSSIVKKPPGLAVMAETEVINFNGITPGISQRIEVLRAWGDPRSDDTQAEELRYRFDNLHAVHVRFVGNLVDSIIVELEKPMSISTLTRKLNLQEVRPATLKDNDGIAIAQVYPERGVMLSFAELDPGLVVVSDDKSNADKGPQIDTIVIQPLEAEPFLLRADSNALGNLTDTIADLEAALQMDSSLSVVLMRLSKIHLQTGKAVTAERLAAEAVELEPKNIAYRLQWAKCLRQLARYDRAVQEVRHVLETPGIALLTRAKSLNEMGLLASLGSQKVAQRAMALHTKAIEIADRLAVGDDLLISRQAKQLLVESHLAIAVEISLGTWKQKDKSVPQWIERASALSEALIDEDESYLPLRLQVAVSSLAAVANLEKPIDPLLWIEEAEETVAEIKRQALDPLAASQYDWQLGLAYFHGSQIQHRRSEPDSAIHLGELADVQLADLARQRDEMPDTAYLLGRLYFQIGAVYAVHYEDHAAACEWYNEAVDRLLTPVPVTTLAAPQQHGDALVSMGVSYWNQKNHSRAIEVTQSGVELIEEAVNSGLLETETLMVSYGNLSAMYSAKGKREYAARYEKLAREIKVTDGTLRR